MVGDRGMIRFYGAWPGGRSPDNPVRPQLGVWLTLGPEGRQDISGKAAAMVTAA